MNGFDVVSLLKWYFPFCHSSFPENNLDFPALLPLFSANVYLTVSKTESK